MSWKTKYNHWLNFLEMDTELKEQLHHLADNHEELEDSFYKYLEFGTGGMRGLIGPGTNRVNMYTVRKAAEGLARYIEDYGEEAKMRGVVIAYDSRHKSPEFAMEAAKTLGHHGIQTYVFESLRTTPELSFAIRYLHAFSGIVITASHNPAEYNGFKVYGKDGAQFASDDADVIVEKVKEIEDELMIPVVNAVKLKKSGILTMINNTVDQAYLKQLKSIVVNPSIVKQVADDFQIVYTPLHGTGNVPVRRGLASIGFKHVQVVEQQEEPDEKFSTVAKPNPEEPAAFELAIKYGERFDADILLATDPDTDRVGVAVKKAGTYQLLTGNQIGALLLNYLIIEKQKRNKLPENATVLKTIVTSDLGRAIAAAYGLETIDTLTGFKYISDKIKEFEETGEHKFLFGYEESYGYLIGDFVRDKDAVQTCLLIAEVAAYYKTKDLTLYEGLLEIFEKYGFYKEAQESITLEGKSGVEKIAVILEEFRDNPPVKIAGRRVIAREDYLSGECVLINKNDGVLARETINLPTSNVLKYKLEGDAWLCVRPSGTESKIKFYFGVREETLVESEKALEKLTDAVMRSLDSEIKRMKVGRI